MDPPPPPPSISFKATPSSISQEAKMLIDTYRTVHGEIVASTTPETATFDSVILPLAHAENAFLTGWRTLRFFQSVSADRELRDASRESDGLLGAFGIEVKQRHDLFRLIDAVVKRKDSLDPESDHLLTTIHREMRKMGTSLPPEPRNRFGDIQRRILELSSQFSANAQRPSQPAIWFSLEELAGVPEGTLGEMEKGSGVNEGKLCASFNEHFMSVMRFATSPETRKRMYIGYYNRCSENAPIFKEVAVLRDEAARLLGYRNHATLVVEDRMARNTETVHALLNKLREDLVPGGSKAMERYSEEKRRDFEARGEEWDGKTYLWDMNYYGRKAAARETKVDLSEISEYFPLQVMVGRMLETMGNLFGLVFQELKLENEDKARLLWRDDVQVFGVRNTEDEGGEFLGHLYLDLYSYEFKRSGSWCSNLRPGYLKPDGSRAHASVALICDFTRPTATKPCILSHMDATMLFHELGHGIHDLVSTTKYGRFHGSAGTVIDFGEAPSQVLENWFLIPSELKRLSRHYSFLSDNYLKAWREKKAAALGRTDGGSEIPPPETQLPDHMITALLQSKGTTRVLTELGQLCMSTWDFAVHDQDSHEAIKSLNLSEFYNRLQSELYPPAGPPDLGEGFEWGHPYCTWSMLVEGDYHAGYYSYALSEVYSADIFDTFFKADPTSAAQGRRYRHALLEPGGSRPEMETLLAFLGREPNPGPLLKSLGIVGDAATP
ncbi:thimet oligopeptidase [Podospora aff. communis PSN243]|uniref:Thimet oligopeptidase n=1 Tax=Podospora aff. communis PSN243 TaxID=3040156 RepID=A0AAV9GG39_9PEZI|nr:thimet oligopeptidase [Podospora aff. communis PSN243]